MEKNTKVLLLVGGAVYHDQPEQRKILSDFMGAEFNLTMTDNLEVLNPSRKPASGVGELTLDNYNVIVNYTTFAEPTEEQVGALLDAVKERKDS
jgi:hypothetical protein